MKNLQNISDIDRHVASKLRKFRSEAGMSQAKLAESIGISFQQIQKYESVKNKISIKRLFEFSQVLQISIAAFFDGVGHEVDKCEFTNRSFRIGEKLYSTDQIKEFLPLIKAYSKIEDEEVRKNILELAQNVSKLDLDVDE